MKLFTTLSLLFLSWAVFATGDSLNYLLPQDSVFLTVDESTQKIIEHRLEQKQTMYSLAKFYGLELPELMYYNLEWEEGNIPIGATIKIPIPNRAIKRYRTKNFDESKHAAIYFKVQKGNTLYHVAKRLFKMPIEDIQKRNGLKGNDIQPGQLLHVGWISTDGVPREYRKLKPLPPEWQVSQMNGQAFLSAKGIKAEHLQRGVAYWNKNSKATENPFALHASAPINSIIEVTNPMNNRTLFVKVTGRPSTNTYYGKNTIVVLSPKAAKMLGAYDRRFFVNLRFLK